MLAKIEVYYGDAKNVLSELVDCSIDLIVTSPPYADQRNLSEETRHYLLTLLNL